MIAAAILIALLAGLAAWIFRAGRTSATAETAARDAEKVAADERAKAEYAAGVAAITRTISVEEDRLRALPPDDLARAAERLLNDPEPGDPRSETAPPRA